MWVCSVCGLHHHWFYGSLLYLSTSTLRVTLRATWCSGAPSEALLALSLHVSPASNYPSARSGVLYRIAYTVLILYRDRTDVLRRGSQARHSTGVLSEDAARARTRSRRRSGAPKGPK